MRLDNPKDLFVYELSAMYDGENRIAEMLTEVADRVGDETLTQMLRTHQQETRQQAKNLEQCFQQLGTSPQQVTCGPVEAIHREYREFLDRQPSADVLTMFALGGAAKIEHFEIASYRGLVGKAMLMGETKCIQLLETNLLQEEETAGKLERFANELGQRMLATA
ncbi:ferritin-like metal-binding protein YciE [Spinactinospora alkalitolerans]|uniref:Ferritin-like metal-binding protein YciE n=1 Tax=Spinactinospora alkalitolerans TaxID=687207 RepID=A0A852TTX5_9ACTN|nr:DUF892 family protein [Spinactinospora alkalitolerans]NYE47111.1 ferritin-like metal-binding protein YciE [Spinactinospora alkalitolerans]